MGYDEGRRGDKKAPHIEFVEYDDTGCTKKWYVKNIHSGTIIATIRWYGAWRKYALFPEEGTVWDNNCMTTVIAFIQKEMNKRRNKQ